MVWPTSDVTTTSLDATTDSPATARAHLLDLAQKFNQVRNHASVFIRTLLDDADATAARATLLAAKSGANTDITSLSAPALGAATATTQAVGNNTTKVATTAYVDASVRGPTFSAHLAVSGGSVPNSAQTKLLFDTESWDSNGNFASSRFTPTVAGYYLISAGLQLSASAPGFLAIWKNVNEWKRGAWTTPVGAQQDFHVSGIVQCNGAGDYIEIRAFQSSGGALVPQGVSTITWFDGCFLRGL